MKDIPSNMDSTKIVYRVTHNLLVISQEIFYITCNKFRQLMNVS